MTVDELLKTRYRVKADWPGVAGIVIPGQILTQDDEYIDDLYWVGGEPFTEGKLKDYPHLFKKLEWYEDRTPDEMPEYVKDKFGEIYKFYGFRMGFMDVKGTEYNYGIPPEGMQPATQEEYLAYQNTVK